MSKITKIGEGKNKSNRVSIYVDEQFICFLNSFTVYKYKLVEGQEIDIEWLKQIQMENEKDTAFNLAIKYLSKYVKTESEIKDYLISKGFLPELVSEVISKIKDYKYIDDQKYVETFIECSKNKYGINKIKMMLKQKGISENLLNKIQVEPDKEMLNNLVQKYMNKKEKTRENFQKCAKFLYSRGFSWDTISKAVSQLKEDK